MPIGKQFYCLGCQSFRHTPWPEFPTLGKLFDRVPKRETVGTTVTRSPSQGPDPKTKLVGEHDSTYRYFRRFPLWKDHPLMVFLLVVTIIFKKASTDTRRLKDGTEVCAQSRQYGRIKPGALYMVTRKILIVEDEPAVALSFQHILKRSLEYNYVVTVVESAEEANDSIKKAGAYDVILLDYYLPGITGGEFLKNLRSRDHQTVVLVISASQDYRIVHDTFKLGADDYITKEELSNQYVLEKSILAGLEKREYQKETNRSEIARQRIEAITTIIRTVHHELNNPMAILDLTLGKLQSSVQAGLPANAAHIREIQENIGRMSDILRRLHNFKQENYNDELRGLKLFALPDTPSKENGS